MIDAFLEHATGLEARALEILRRPEVYPGLPALRRSDVILRLIKFEGLGKYYSWAVAERADTCVVRRVIWDRPTDHRPSAIDPTTFASDANAPADFLEQHVAALRSMVLSPFIPCDTVGLDGVHFGVEYGNHMLSAGLYWWSLPPEDWRPLAEWFSRCAEAFEALLPSHVGEPGGHGA
jgi:hypothetical protein